MRDYTHIDHYLDVLLGEVYPQPQDGGHTALAQEVIDLWMSRLPNTKSVLDVGCGEGFCQPMFEKWGATYEGVALGQDVINAFNQNRNVKRMDFNFLDYPDKSFDMVFARHSLEHSPMPILTLMEWWRVSKGYLGIVLPAPEHYTFEGLNHYSVMSVPQFHAICLTAGWHPIWTDIKEVDHPVGVGVTKREPTEYWIFCEKVYKK